MPDKVNPARVTARQINRIRSRNDNVLFSGVQDDGLMVLATYPGAPAFPIS